MQFTGQADSAGSGWCASTSSGGSRGLVDANGNLVESLKVGNVPVGFEENGSSFFLTMIGTFSPSDIPRGGTCVRTAHDHTSLADLNADGDTDLIVSMYGNNISSFELREHVILPRSGTLSTAVHDRDGHRRAGRAGTRGDSSFEPRMQETWATRRSS